MSRFRLAVALAAVFTVGACSDSQSPSTPSDESQPLRVVIDDEAAAVDSDAGVRADAAELGTLGRGKSQKLTLDPETVFCFDKRLHEFCFDLRNSRVRAADGDAIVTKNVRSTRGELRLNGRLVAWTNKTGPWFIGNVIFARYRGMNLRVFAGDKLCHKFKGNPAPQVCAKFTR